MEKVGTISPSFTEPYMLICTYTVQVVLSILTGLVMVIIAYGAIGATIIGLLGPIFIPWMVFEPTSSSGDGSRLSWDSNSIKSWPRQL